MATWKKVLTDATAAANSSMLVGNGSTMVAESGSTLRTSIGLGTSGQIQFDELYVSQLEVDGDPVMTEASNINDFGGTDLTVANGGTGASSASTALSNLGGLAKGGGTMSGTLTMAGYDVSAVGRLTFNISGATIDTVHHQSDLSSNDATALATQMSIKAYVDLGYNRNGHVLSEYYDDVSGNINVYSSHVSLGAFGAFKAPTSGIVMYEIQAYVDNANNKFMEFGIATNSGLTGIAVDDRRVHYNDESDQYCTIYKVRETGLTSGTSYNRWAFAVTNSSSTSYIRKGGNYPPIILRVLSSGF